MVELHAEDRRLERIHPLSVPDLVVSVLRSPTVIAQLADPADERLVVTGDRSGIAVRSKVLARIEAERGEIRKGADPTTIDLGPMRLRRILDHRQSAPSRDVTDGDHVRRLAVEMDG